MTLTEDARRLNLRARRRTDPARIAKPCSLRRHLPALILLSDETRLADPRAAIARLPRGAAVILRHYGLSPTDRADLARRLRALTRRKGVLLLIAVTDRRSLALARTVGADGIHLPEWRLRQGAWRSLIGRKPNALVTGAAHSWPALRRAAAWGLDAVLLSPVFPTASHRASHREGRALGPLRFSSWARRIPIPVYPLGGIDRRSAARLRSSPACGLAGIGGLI